MKITLKRTQEQLELVKAMASKNREVAYEAQMALAEFIGPVLAEVVNNAPTLSNLFTSVQFDADDNPSIPLDLYHDITDGDYIKVWSQSVAGGLPSNTVMPTHSELKFATYRLDSAVDFDRKYAAKSRLDVISKTFTRVAQEVLLKQEKTSANLVLGTLSDAGVSDSDATKHTIESSIDGRLMLDDLNRLMTRAKRVNSSWSGGTPDRSRGITDLIVSPEIVQSLREMSYNSINTKASDGSALATSDESGSEPIAATDSLRDALFSAGGLPEFYGMSIMEINELGASGTYTDIYNTLTGGFQSGKTDIVVAIDRSRDAMLRAVAVDSESGGEFNLVADDQYSVRQQKIGYYGMVEEGRMVVDNRGLFGIEV
tara:strand:- start:967 stop:2079 length:1113 start_codon:yes stop_codon:yes gene_type:complete